MAGPESPCPAPCPVVGSRIPWRVGDYWGDLWIFRTFGGDSHGISEDPHDDSEGMEVVTASTFGAFKRSAKIDPASM